MFLWLATFPAAAAGNQDTRINLTPEEQAFIRENPVIRVHNEIDWPPFNFFEDGRPQGFSIDYMNILASMIGIKVKYVTGPTWNEFLGEMKSGDLDVMLNIVKTPERLKYLLYTKPYAYNPNSILSRDVAPYSSLEQLFGKTVALPKGFFYEEILKRDFPRIKLYLVKNVAESMKAVVFGKADAALGELAVFNYLMERDMLTGLTLSGEVKLGGVNYSELQIAVRKDSPVLASILLKAMDAVDPEEIKKLRQRWISVAAKVSPNRKLLLTTAEKAWIKSNPVVKMAALRDWPPFDFQDDLGRHAGVAAELAKVVAKRAGFKLDLTFDDWDVLLGKLEAGKLDMAASIYKTPEREPLLNFTEPYLELYDAILTAEATDDVTTAADLNGRTVALEKGFYTNDLLRRDFPKIRILTVANTREALKAVSAGKADAYIGTQYVASYLIRKYVIPNLKTVGFLGNSPNKIYMATRKGLPILRDILNKALASISEDEKQDILRKFIVLDAGAKKKTDLVRLTAEEKTWLGGHKYMRFGIDPGYPPFEFVDENGVFSGMSSDYVRLVGERLGITMEMVPGLSWAKVISGMKDRTIDFSPAVVVTSGRETFMNFSSSYMTFPVVIVTRDDYSFVAGLDDLNGSKVAMVKEFAVTNTIKEDYPRIIPEMVKTPLQALRFVAQGKTGAAVMNLAVATYLIKKNNLANLKVAAPAEIELPGLSFAVRKDWPEFADIIDKALDSITPEEESAIRAKWAQVSYSTGINLKLVLQVGGVASAILIVILVWNRRLQHEVTQRKLAEKKMEAAKNEAERLTKAKSDFVAVISHEIRTPMNGVLGMARLLTETKLDEEQRECVDTVVSSGEALVTIIDDLLDLSKLDAGKLEIESRPFVAADIVEQSIGLMKSRADEKRLELRSVIDERIPGVVVGDSNRLRQIILNLISNAIKFTGKGSVSVEAKVESRTQDVAALSFTVTDTGKGIPPEERKKLFSAYSQGSAAVARKYGGTGLGLAICRRLATLMDGEITVDSIIGKGSAFRFKANFKIDTVTDAASLWKKQTAGPLSPANKQAAHPLRVLQVEDNETNRTVIERVLSRVGHIVISVEDGKKALEALKSGDFDVVLMDRHMPVMDGLRATRRIRRMDGPIASIPIIGITASASQDEMDACREAGMDDCLTKPVEAVKLRSLLEKLGSGNKSRPAASAPAVEVDEPVQSAAGRPPVDLEQLSRILGEDDEEELFFMLDIFIREFPKLLGNLENAVKERNAASVRERAHAAKGAAANAAAIMLTEMLKEIEAGARLENWDETITRTGAVKSEYDRLLRFCRDTRNNA